MAKIDSSILPIIKILLDNSMDWLAVEVIETIHQGYFPAVTEDSLDKVRMIAMKQERSQQQEIVERGIPQPTEDDNQLRWAVEYILDRLTFAIESLKLSIDNLEEIGCPRDGEDIRYDSNQRPMTLVLLENEKKYVVSARELEEASRGLQILRDALNSWLDDQQGDIQIDTPGPSSAG
jgi:hypothetical protein